VVITRIPSPFEFKTETLIFGNPFFAKLLVPPAENRVESRLPLQCFYGFLTVPQADSRQPILAFC